MFGSFGNKIKERFARKEKSRHTYTDPNQFSTIYRFPYLGLAITVNRFKFYQTAFVCCLLPLCAYYYVNDSIDLFAVLATTSISMFACLMLFVFGYISRKLIGIIYLSKDEEIVRFAKLTFFGRRVNEDVPLKNIYCLKDNNELLDKYWLHVKREGMSSDLFLVTKFGPNGGIVDGMKFGQVFGVTPEELKRQ